MPIFQIHSPELPPVVAERSSSLALKTLLICPIILYLFFTKYEKEKALAADRLGS
jgi:hypothetical protein